MMIAYIKNKQDVRFQTLFHNNMTIRLHFAVTLFIRWHLKWQPGGVCSTFIELPRMSTHAIYGLIGGQQWIAEQTQDDENHVLRFIALKKPVR
jgi:hypothetical protein